MDDKILFLYAQGLSTREIVKAFDDLYGAEVSPTLVSKVTDTVIDQVVEWQSRPLDEVYPIVYLDCIVVKILQDKTGTKAVYLALGVNLASNKDLLGLWISENEGAKFWLNVLTELQNRGVTLNRKTAKRKLPGFFAVDQAAQSEPLAQLSQSPQDLAGTDRCDVAVQQNQRHHRRLPHQDGDDDETSLRVQEL